MTLPALSPASLGLLCTLAGYLSGSFLASYTLPLWLCHVDVTETAPDGNPGAFNAIRAVGLPLGLLCLACDILKGTWPVLLATALLGPESPWLALALAAPVLGHAHPLFHRQQGGKAIAVSFGVLLGLWPNWGPVWILAILYLISSLVLVITPHSARSVFTFALWCLAVLFTQPLQPVRIGCFGVAAIVVGRHLRAADGEKAQLHLGRRA